MCLFERIFDAVNLTFQTRDGRPKLVRQLFTHEGILRLLMDQ